MPRPRKCDGVPSMKEQIEHAFWDFLTQKPFEKISVKEVCQAAGCNKTTFYYHFQDLREVLDAIEEKCLPLEAPDLLSDLITTENREAIAKRLVNTMDDRFEKYCILLSSHGDPDFAKKAKEIMLQRWCKKMQLDYEMLSAEDQTAIRFAMGGSISICADHGDGAPFEPKAYATVISTMIAPLLVKLSQEASRQNGMKTLQHESQDKL